MSKPDTYIIISLASDRSLGKKAFHVNVTSCSKINTTVSEKMCKRAKATLLTNRTLLVYSVSLMEKIERLTAWQKRQIFNCCNGTDCIHRL